MIGIQLRCGECGELTTMVARSLFTVSRRTPRDFTERMQRDFKLRENGAAEVAWFGICEHCGQPIMAFTVEPMNTVPDLIKTLQQPNEPPLRFGDRPILEVFPPEPKPRVFHGVDGDVLEAYDNLWKAHRSGMSPNAVAGQARTCLEVACRRFVRDEVSLVRKIDAMLAQGKITDGIAEWAHRLRVVGNKAVHEMGATADEVRETIAFVELLLEVLFALPARIDDAKL